MSTVTFLAQPLWNIPLFIMYKNIVFQRMDWKQLITCKRRCRFKWNGFTIISNVDITGCVSTKSWNIFLYHGKDILTLHSNCILAAQVSWEFNFKMIGISTIKTALANSFIKYSYIN
jgi:hypothetical protein